MTLIDTHVLLAVMKGQTAIFPARIRKLLAEPVLFHVSVVSFWEIAIKWRLGKLEIPYPLGDIPGIVRSFAFEILPVDEHHVLALVDPEPATRDPFDRLLLAQCQVEGMRLMTIDRALAGHPLTA